MNENTKMKVEETFLTIGTVFYLCVNIVLWCFFLGVIK